MASLAVLGRAWVNQPSTLQPMHHYHKKNCIVVDEGIDNYYRLYFTEGAIHSLIAPKESVSFYATGKEEMDHG